MSNWNIYLSGEIHTDWRERISKGITDAQLPVTLFSPNTDHASSDDCGDAILGKEELAFWKDHKASKINSIRIRQYIQNADIVVVRFGDKYKQWNAAFDAGCCAALGKPYITLHDESIIHPLKEVDAAAMAWAQTPQQIVEILSYVTNRE